ncbi:MAG TPA: diguanylate cyclase [Methylophilaceae bacterium]|nr:diguanylate cyclase [Methylophilaceae bacterium]
MECIAREEGTPINFTISIGVSSLKDKGTTLDVLLSQVDAAMYEAKQSGRNKVTIAT